MSVRYCNAETYLSRIKTTFWIFLDGMPEEVKVRSHMLPFLRH